MAKIRIESRMRSFQNDMEELFFRSYGQDGVLHEERITTREIDYYAASFSRFSRDNGRTWTEWTENFRDREDGRRGAVAGSEEGDELLAPSMEEIFDHKTANDQASIYDPKTGCSVGFFSTQYCLKGHDVGYFAWWETGEDNWRPHPHYAVRYPDGREVVRMLMLEEGAEYDPANPRNPAYIDRNRGFAGTPRMLSDGRIIFFHMANMELCCRMAGVDVNAFFPSCPKFQMGLLIGHLNWNAEKQDYDITYSNPIMLSDLQSSRGVMEPLLEELPDGRLLVVLRGSNTQMEVWNTRISKSAPGFKWFTISCDGGRSFPPLMPWHYDTREVVYSPATISHFFRSTKNGRLYWIGNVYEEAWKIEGNSPRNKLYICQVDEEECCLLKDTLTLVDTMREGETDVELSNFNLMENRETKELELRLTKINFNGAYQGNDDPNAWYSEAWEYFITFEE